MQPDDPDAAYVWEIVAAARKLRAALDGVAREDYDANELMRLAIERLLQNIGEAVRRLSPDFRAAHPEIPWQDIVGQRNVLVHEYSRIDHNLVWLTATSEIPDFIVALEALLPSV
jgi:uncharacterized protein with HEPN domain